METTEGEAPGLLGRVRIASPCPTSWESMEGDDRVRFCRLCSLNVYNLSALTRAEAEALVARAEGRLCGRFYRRADGTVLTQDCPTGLSAVRRRVRRTTAAVFAAIASLWTAAAGQTASPKGGQQGQESAVACEGGGQLKIRRKPVPTGEPASLSGTVRDPNGAFIPGAVVTLTNELTKEKASAMTDEEGAFSLAALSPGNYTLRIETVAFKPQEVKGVAVTAEESLSIESVLAISAGEGVFVGIILVDFGPEQRNGNGKTVFDSEQILKLPRP